MESFTLSSSKNVFIVAEIGNNHEGKFDVAQELIRQAAEAGVDAVKFQTYIPGYISGGNIERLERLKSYQLSHDEFLQLANLAEHLDMVFFSTPFDIESARFLNKVQPLFKIASGDNNFFPLIDAVAGFQKPLIVSTGLADLKLLDSVYARVMKIWKDGGVTPDFSFLHCVTSYPAPREQVNLSVIRTLIDRYPDAVVGYSDHTIGIDVAVQAVAVGAKIIEKHFTLDKKFSEFRDHQLSADPSDMKNLVAAIKELKVILGSGEKFIQPCENENVAAIRRSVVAARDIPLGTVVGDDDITWARPGIGLSPGMENQVVDKRVNRDYRFGEVFQLDDLS